MNYEADLFDCANEPIRTPGAIQPHGVLLVVDAQDLTVSHVSDSCIDLIGLDPQDIVGKSLDLVVTARTIETLREGMKGDLGVKNPLPAVMTTASDDVTCDLIAHRLDSKVIIELEPRDIQTQDATFAQLHASVVRLANTTSFADFVDALAVEIRVVTGFDRVMVYRFDREWNGEVIAEASRTGLTPYLGSRFPASDIPSQARALYLENPIRIISDASYTPSRVWADAEAGELDMTNSILRSVSPVHIKYLENMGVAASMSVSLVRDEKLWGLVACHHYDGPRLLSYNARGAALFIAQEASRVLTEKERADRVEASAATQAAQTAIVDRLTQAVGLAAALVDQEPSIADMIGASGAAALIDGELRTVGEVPERRWLDDIALHLDYSPEATGLGREFITDSLSRLDDHFQSVSNIASGVIALPVPAEVASWLMWFRPEIASTVSWAGNPDEKVIEERGDGTKSLGPRKSFEIRKQQLRGSSEPWAFDDVRAAREIRLAVTKLIANRS